ncbi:hypothetical protein NPIL_235261 [Nephila pilipes]|uniref:Uncharacterized protein n=1 Tax=Nephila pilipes TaxID=299642 RepID=A0A8X6M6K0_NEPPI|nr:hypothetical protein NPIL_235261 [Nephila pilipes]
MTTYLELRKRNSVVAGNRGDGCSEELSSDEETGGRYGGSREREWRRTGKTDALHLLLTAEYTKSFRVPFTVPPFTATMTEMRGKLKSQLLRAQIDTAFRFVRGRNIQERALGGDPVQG